jgi:hypothetical protein
VSASPILSSGLFFRKYCKREFPLFIKLENISGLNNFVASAFSTMKMHNTAKIAALYYESNERLTDCIWMIKEGLLHF